jgi:DNA-binding GntR family transcriptional regulator
MKVRATNVGRMASAAGVIFEALQEAIVQGEMRDGEVLRQDQIAGLFNVSRIPVREALTRLEEHGLVTQQRYKGAVVSSLSVAEIREVFEFRAILEPEVIRHSVRNISTETLELARRQHEAFATEPDSAKWAKLNLDFHYALYRDAERPFYLKVVRSALGRVGRYLRAQLVLTDGMVRARAEHEEILQACIDRDADLAAERTRRHILGASDSLVDFLGRSGRG